VALFRLNRGDRLHYRLRGHGQALLLLHGLGCSGADWELQARALERRFRVIVPDLPGNGHSSPPSAGYSIAGIAATIWALLDHLHLAQINIVGFSLGGAVALEMALQRPEAVPRLVLINSLASYRIDHWRKWLEARVPPLLVGVIGMRRAAHMMARRLFPKPWQRPLRQRAASMLGTVPVRCYLGMALALESWSSKDRLAALKSRTLLIAAEYDYTPLAEKYALASALNADIVVVRGSRHGTPFDSIETTNACILAALSDAPLPAPPTRACDQPCVLRQWALACGLAQDDSDPAAAQQVSWRAWGALRKLPKFSGIFTRYRALLRRRRAYGLGTANALKGGAPTLG
jgi:3-oxoadipate enol-lactonase